MVLNPSFHTGFIFQLPQLTNPPLSLTIITVSYLFHNYSFHSMILCERAIKRCDVIPDRFPSIPFEIKLNHLDID